MTNKPMLSGKPETLCLSQLGFHAATGSYGSKIGERDPMLVEIGRMGITYFRFMHDRFGDSIWLFNARNVPVELPEWIDRKHQQASVFVGRSAMTQAEADAIEKDAANER